MPPYAGENLKENERFCEGADNYNVCVRVRACMCLCVDHVLIVYMGMSMRIAGKNLQEMSGFATARRLMMCVCMWMCVFAPVVDLFYLCICA